MDEDAKMKKIYWVLGLFLLFEIIVFYILTRYFS